MKICSLRNENPLENEGEDVNKKPRMQKEHRLAQRRQRRQQETEEQAGLESEAL